MRAKSVLEWAEEYLEGHARHLAAEDVREHRERVECADAGLGSFGLRPDAFQLERAYNVLVSYHRARLGNRLALAAAGEAYDAILLTRKEDPAYHG